MYVYRKAKGLGIEKDACKCDNKYHRAINKGMCYFYRRSLWRSFWNDHNDGAYE